MGTGRTELDPRPRLRALERRRAILAGLALVLFGAPFLGAFLSPTIGAFGLIAWLGAIGIAISRRRIVLHHSGQNARTLALGADVLAGVARGLHGQESDTARLFRRFATAEQPVIRRWCFERLLGPHGFEHERSQAIRLGL